MPGYLEKIPDDIETYYLNLPEKISLEVGQVEFINWSERELEDGFYLDPDHINALGAKVVSKDLDELLSPNSVSRSKHPANKQQANQ